MNGKIINHTKTPPFVLSTVEGLDSDRVFQQPARAAHRDPNCRAIVEQAGLDPASTQDGILWYGAFIFIVRWRLRFVSQVEREGFLKTARRKDSI